MFKRIRAIAFSLVLVASLLPFGTGQSVANASNSYGKVVIANRVSGTISVIDVATDQVVNTITLPGANPEPMYVVYVKKGNQVFVGDRANNQVVSYDADNFNLLGTVPAGNGVFHMWAGGKGKQLWVNNDIDNTVTVIKPRTRQVIATVPMPADLVASGWKPHDVIVGPQGKRAFVTLVNATDNTNDYVVKYSTDTFQEMARAAVGKDPHVSLTKGNDMLYVPNQGGNQVTVLKRKDLSFVTNIAVPAAHGAGMRTDGKFFYTTNIAGGGMGGLVTIDIKNKNASTVVGATNTPFAIPHNIALTPNGKKIYVTHSGGMANQVTVYTASKQQPVPVLTGSVTVGTNPFGLAYVP